MNLSAVLGAVSIIVLLAVASPLLGLFGKGYEQAAFPLQLLAIGYLPTAVKLHYIAVSRAVNRIGHAAMIMSFGGVLELGGAWLGATLGGLNGLTAGFVLATVAEAVITGPTVVRAAVSGRVRLGSRTADQCAKYELRASDL